MSIVEWNKFWSFRSLCDASQPKSYLLLVAAAIHNSRAQKRLTPGVIPTQFLVSQSFHSWSRWSVGGRLWLQGTFGSDYGCNIILKEKIFMLENVATRGSKFSQPLGKEKSYIVLFWITIIRHDKYFEYHNPFRADHNEVSVDISGMRGSVFKNDK